MNICAKMPTEEGQIKIQENKIDIPDLMNTIFDKTIKKQQQQQQKTTLSLILNNRNILEINFNR